VKIAQGITLGTDTHPFLEINPRGDAASNLVLYRSIKKDGGHTAHQEAAARISAPEAAGISGAE
jgi:hypothetical protein